MVPRKSKWTCDCCKGLQAEVRRINVELRAIERSHEGLSLKLTAMDSRSKVIVPLLSMLNQQAQAANDTILPLLSEETSIRLQMAEDRKSRVLTTLSNILKKQAETVNGIVANLK